MRDVTSELALDGKFQKDPMINFLENFGQTSERTNSPWVNPIGSTYKLMDPIEIKTYIKIPYNIKYIIPIPLTICCSCLQASGQDLLSEEVSSEHEDFTTVRSCDGAVVTGHGGLLIL